MNLAFLLEILKIDKILDNKGKKKNMFFSKQRTDFAFRYLIGAEHHFNLEGVVQIKYIFLKMSKL